MTDGPAAEVGSAACKNEMNPINADITERGATRADDRISEAAMEDRKKDGYF